MASTSPERTARSVSKASLRRAVNSWRERVAGLCEERFFPLSANPCRLLQPLLLHADIQSGEHFLKVRQVPNEPSLREWEVFNECGYRDYLLVPGEVRLLVNVDDLKVIPIL